jgi:hypothetical protein
VPELVVIGTAHRERGRCSASALLHCLRHLAPRVVFSESSPTQLASPGSLEGAALRDYGADRDCRVVPVDDYEAPPDRLATMGAAFERVFRYVEQASDEYRALKDLSDHESFTYGLEYLNSRQFEALNARLEVIEDQVVGQCPDERVRSTLQEWRSIQERRELAMVDKIYDHFHEHGFDLGVFLVGAAHKRSILRKASRTATATAVPIIWSTLEEKAGQPLPPAAS